MESYYLGIDASKGYADFVLLSEARKPIEKGFRLNDTFDGHCKLYEILSKYTGKRIFAGIESTGGYESNWYHALRKVARELNMFVARVNPFAVHHSAKATMRKNTTDKISAINIAEYLIDKTDAIDFDQDDSFGSLRRQWRYIALLSKQRTQVINQLLSVLYVCHPQLIKHCRDLINQWILRLLIQYPTAKHLSRARITTIENIPFLRKHKAAGLISDAKSAVASATDEVTAQLVVTLAKKLYSMEREIAEQVKLLRLNCDIPEVDLLKTFVGIGEQSALGLILEIGAIERFSSVKKMASFFGLHPVYKISGDGVGGIRMSKCGRKEPRRILFIVSLSSIRRNAYIREIYLTLLDRGMSKMAAIGVIMHKIMRIIYGMLKNKTPYKPETDQYNRSKVISARKSYEDKSDYRYQPVDNDAPISYRRYLKRKRQKESQLVNQ